MFTSKTYFQVPVKFVLLAVLAVALIVLMILFVSRAEKPVTYDVVGVSQIVERDEQDAAMEIRKINKNRVFVQFKH